MAEEKGLSPAMIDRLTLDARRIRGMADGLRAVAEQRDPVGEVIAEWDVPSRPRTSSASARRSASSASSTRAGPTSPPTPAPSASSPATP